jgi:hypothetical protein
LTITGLTKAKELAMQSVQGSPSALPAYLQPNLYPIEQALAKLKHLIKAAKPRAIEAGWRKAGDLLDLFSEKECANHLRNSGYLAA